MNLNKTIARNYVAAMGEKAGVKLEVLENFDDSVASIPDNAEFNTYMKAANDALREWDAY